MAFCNDWAYFVTLTINDEKCDRYDLNIFMKALSKWLNNQKSRKAEDIKYLLVPEPHKDGAWHMHGLMNGIPDDQLEPFTLNDNIPERIRALIREGCSVFNWLPYNEKFGWVTVEAIREKEKCAAYIKKYITKELEQSHIELNHHIYYASQGLSRPQIIYCGEIRKNFEPDYQNDYVRVKYFDNGKDPMFYFE